MTPRLPKLAVGELEPDQRALYEAIAEGPRSSGPFALADREGRLEGPFNAMLLSPALGQALQGLGAAIRYRSALTDRAREIAILVVAQHWDSAFERYAHEAVGRSIGLSEAELDALRRGRAEDLSDPDERLVARTTATLASQGDLTDGEYAEARDFLGDKGLFELMTLVGYYATLALQLRVFRVEAPD